MHTVTTLAELLKNEDGATAIEYGLIAALIAVAAVVAMTAVGTNLAALFTVDRHQPERRNARPGQTGFTARTFQKRETRAAVFGSPVMATCRPLGTRRRELGSRRTRGACAPPIGPIIVGLSCTGRPRAASSMRRSGSGHFQHCGLTLFQPIGFALKILGHAQAGFPDRRVRGLFREFAIPRGQLPQLQWVIHRPRPRLPGSKSPTSERGPGSWTAQFPGRSARH